MKLSSESFPWKIEHMDISLLKKYKVYTIIEGYSDLECSHEDFLFVQGQLEAKKINSKYFYTVLWLVVYYRKERFEEMPHREFEAESKARKEKEIKKILKLKEELLQIWDKDDDEFNFKHDSQKSKLVEVKFYVKGKNGGYFKTDARLLLDGFYNLLRGVMDFQHQEQPKRKTNNKKEITKVIESLKPFAEILFNERILPSKNQVYLFIEELLKYYNFKTYSRLDFTAQIKNTLKLTQ